jgi:hypothetical protein
MTSPTAAPALLCLNDSGRALAERLSALRCTV